MIDHKTPVKDIVGRQRVAGTGWGTTDIEKAELPEFVPQPDDIIVEPTTPTVGFSVNIISPGIPARDIGHLHLPVPARYERGTAPIIEVEIFDWMAKAQPKRLVTSLFMIAPSGDGAWLLDDVERFNTLEDAVTAVVMKHGKPHTTSGRNDGGINLRYQRIEDDPFSG